MVAEQAGGGRIIERFLHLVGGVGCIGHAGSEIVEEVAHQEETVVRLAFDDLVRSPEFVVDIGQNQPAHCGRGHWVTAMHP